MNLKTLILTTALLGAVFAGCLGPADDEDLDLDDYTGPNRYVQSFENTKPAVATGLKGVARLMLDEESYWPAGGGNWVQGDLVFGSALWNSFFIADISDPANPKLLYAPEDPTMSETPFARKAEVVTHADGRLTLALATQNEGIHLWDVTDPANPVFASRVRFPNGLPSHYIAAVPGLEVVLNNPSRGSGSTNHFVDISNPYEPVVLGAVSEVGCHGTTFLNTYGDEKFRAYCAGIDRTEIWDMTGWDPAAEGLGVKILGAVDFASDPANDPVAGNALLSQSPVRSLHHLATANHDGTVLIIGDEHQGGGSPGACFHHDPVTGTSTPLGALWFYDVTDETTPKLLSWISPPMVQPNPMAAVNSLLANPLAGANNLYPAVPNCTAHFGTVVEGEEKIVIGWYSAGVLLIDFTDPTKPAILAQYQPDPVNTWSARYHNGYVFTGDLARGMEVIQLV
jgi:hypothetical protein